MNPWGVTVPTPTEAEFFNAARVTVFLLVEGGSDESFWAARVDSRRCQVRATGGREKALQELDTVRSEGTNGFVAVLDADFDRLDGGLFEDPDVIFTDLHDLETILIASPALDKVLVEVGSRDKLSTFKKEEGHSVRDALLARGLEIARLRLLSRRDKLGLKFRKLQSASSEKAFKYLPYHDFCDRGSWKIVPKDLIQTVLNFSSRHDLKVKVNELLAQMKALGELDAWQSCVGHDLVGLLMVGLRSKLGSRNLQIEEFQERLRLAFERGDLEKTRMYQQLRAWEKRAAPYRIFSW